MSNTYPYPLVLTCTKTGKTATWLNRKIIEAKIEQFGSLEAFQAQYVSRGASSKSKMTTARTWKGKEIGVSPGTPAVSHEFSRDPASTQGCRSESNQETGEVRTYNRAGTHIATHYIRKLGHIDKHQEAEQSA